MGEMPWQLKYAKRPKRTEPRPIAECLPSININDLSQQIPRNYATITLPNAGLKYPQLASMRLTYHSIEVTHTTGRIQKLPAEMDQNRLRLSTASNDLQRMPATTHQALLPLR
jgi:hypothetical protein